MTLCKWGHVLQLDQAFFEVTMMIDEGRAEDVEYIDFSKVFYKVHHNGLNQMIKTHKICQNMLD